MTTNLTLPFGAAVLASALTIGGYVYLTSPAPDTAAADPLTAAELTELRREIAAITGRRTRLEGQLQSLSARIVALEESRSRVVEEGPAPAPESSAAAREAVAKRSPAMTGKAFRGLLPKVLRASLHGAASEDEQAAFWEAARNGKLLPTLLKDLAARIQASPNDPELRMELADAYVAKLLTVPFGPERGVWGMKAEREWKKALDIDPDHWDAQYSMAFNHSMYPDFLNKTDEAIQGFERALALQKRKSHDPKYAQTYLGLARMYQKKGKLDQAITLMRDAVSLYPKNKQAADTLKSLQEAKINRGK